MALPFDELSLVACARALVKIPSVLGHEDAMAIRVRDEMQKLAFDAIETDEAGNVIGVVNGATSGPTLLFDAHMDTVDVVPREVWAHDPFGAELVDGRIYGRGSSDMKGALAAMLHAAGCVDRGRLRGCIVVSASVGEEQIEGAALRCVMDRYHPDFVVIGESSNLNLVRAGRGRAEFILKSHGRPSHASSPAQGLNAVHEMCRVIAEIEALQMSAHSFVGSGVMCLTDIISIPYPAHSVVPSGCQVTYERRLIPGETREALVDELHAACERAKAGDTTIELASIHYKTYTGIEWREEKWYPPWELSEDSSFVRSAKAGLDAAGFSPSFASYQFCTNAAYSAGVAHVPTIGFGPSSEHLAHITDEYLEVAQLTGACRGYMAISESVLGRHQ